MKTLNKIQDRHFRQSMGDTVSSRGLLWEHVFSWDQSEFLLYVKVSWMFWGPERGPIRS